MWNWVILICYGKQDDHQAKKLLSIKDELDTSLHSWKARIEKKDAEKFTVGGRMQETSKLPTINIPLHGDLKRTPELRKFRGRQGMVSSLSSSSSCFSLLFSQGVDVTSTPNSPNIDGELGIKRSYTVIGVPQIGNALGKSKKVRASLRCELEFSSCRHTEQKSSSYQT